ncbi:myeloperoxidase-like [Gracilinanus agilis]|uniref:myeloperoxidase-like n=1 Tax=Gracilinanus agilis TaxID=191870 RepID=UPI001CFC5ECC|nr:myeloperoxidase-like [Gracilinanus agilis]
MEVFWVLVTLNLLQLLATASSVTTDNPLTYEDLMTSVEKAKEIVDIAYESNQQRTNNALENGSATPFDLMKFLKEPRGGTRVATRAADYTETTLKILKEKLLPILGDMNVTGDMRTNEHLGIIVFHTIFLREHNRLVLELKKLNPHWDGEILYQEARKIVGAMIQIINYRDYLPLVLGNEAEQYIPPYTGYNESVDPTVANIFSLAFRFGHGSIPPFISRLDEEFQPTGPNSTIPLHRTFFASWRIILEGGIDPLLRGLLINPSKQLKQDEILNEEVRERLFQQTEVIGLDLAAINLQRGRDHGIPGYNAWRRFCGLSEPETVEELGDVLENMDLAEKFLALYGTADNIDLWIGAMAEPFVPGGRVGPLLSCLIGRQFQQTRDGDRFWWENPGVFTDEQKESLSVVSLPRLFCDNTHLPTVPVDVFQVNNYPEDFINCTEFIKLDLTPWKVQNE